MLNSEEVLATADRVEASERFGMWSCETCIISCVCKQRSDGGLNPRNWDEAAATLGMDEKTAKLLFNPEPGERHSDWYYLSEESEPGYITAAHAVECLRLLAETGEVDWDKAHERMRRSKWANGRPRRRYGGGRAMREVGVPPE